MLHCTAYNVTKKLRTGDADSQNSEQEMLNRNRRCWTGTGKLRTGDAD